MKNYDETISAVFERIDEFEKAKSRKRKNAYKYFVAFGCICLVVATFFSANFAQMPFKDDDPPKQNQLVGISTENSTKKTIYGTDNYNGIQIFEMDDSKDYMTNVSSHLKEEIDQYQSDASYAVIIAGTTLSGKDFLEFKHEGFTYYEYANLLNKAQSNLSQAIERGTPEEQYKIIIDEINDCNKKMDSLIKKYNEFYEKTHGSIFNYLKTNYSFVTFQKPADFNEISLEEYQMLSVVSYETIIMLAKDNFKIYLAPETQKEDISADREGVFLKKTTARVWRDFKRGETIKAFVSIKTDEQLDGVQTSYAEYLYEAKIKLMTKYGITDYKIENDSVLPHIQCILTSEQIERLANDDAVEIITNECELGINEKLQMFGGE